MGRPRDLRNEKDAPISLGNEKESRPPLLICSSGPALAGLFLSHTVGGPGTRHRPVNKIKKYQRGRDDLGS
jgi:hypothetical protein